MASASLFLRGSAWYVTLYFGPKTTKQVALKIYGGEASRAAAQAAADGLLAHHHASVNLQQAIQAAQAAGVLMPTLPMPPTAPGPPTQTLSAWWDEYEAIYESAKTPRTQVIDTQIRHHWEPLIGQIPLMALDEAILMRAQNTRLRSKCLNKATRVSETTVAREVRLVCAVLQKALDNRRIPYHPFKTAPKLTEATREHRVLTEADELKVYAAMRIGKVDAVGRTTGTHPRYRRFIRFLLLTGLRIDELLNDSFTAFPDTTAPTHIRVRGKQRRSAKVILREIGLVAEARQILVEQYADMGSPQSPRPKGCTRPWWQNAQSFRAVLSEMAQRAGVPHFGPHDLRHTFGHRWMLLGRDIKLLSLILGHTSVVNTEKHYAYLAPKDVRNRMLAVMEPELVTA